jgi:hypothetical protein
MLAAQVPSMGTARLGYPIPRPSRGLRRASPLQALGVALRAPLAARPRRAPASRATVAAAVSSDAPWANKPLARCAPALQRPACARLRA